MHWAERRRYTEAWAWLVLIAGGRGPNIDPRKCEVRIHQVRRRRLDTDNLYASCKPILDGLVKAGHLYSDAPLFCNLTVTQETGQPVRTLIQVDIANG